MTGDRPVFGRTAGHVILRESKPAIGSGPVLSREITSGWLEVWGFAGKHWGSIWHVILPESKEQSSGPG
jgi:hypothetical protein